LQAGGVAVKCRYVPWSDGNTIHAGRPARRSPHRLLTRPVAGFFVGARKMELTIRESNQWAAMKPGDIIGGFILVSVVKTSNAGARLWLCSCVKCGAETRIWSTSIHERKTCFSCSPQCDYHGRCGSAIYRIWAGMIQRCTNPKVPGWKWYGAKGVSVCEKWASSFRAFLEDVGERPSDKHSIYRFPNPCGNYEPGNVRWATSKQQAQNTRKKFLLTNCPK